jgi:proline iminopeptidase
LFHKGADMKKIIWMIAAILVVLLAIGGYFWYAMSQPLYQPGMVRAEKNLRAPLTPPAQSGNADYWQVEPDMRLYHFAQGEGQNVLIVHGGPGMPYSQPWAGLEPLTRQYRFHYYDLRGCGKSTRPFERFESKNMYQNMQNLDQTLGLGAQIADIERLRQILGEEKLILIGHSWGGLLAALYAAEFPERVEALILVSPANMLVMPQPEAESDLFASVRQRLPADQQAEFDSFMKEYMDFNTLFTLSEGDLITRNEKFGAYYAQVMGVSSLAPQGEPGGWMVWAQYASLGRRHDYRLALKKVTAPTLVFHGSNDLQSEAASHLYAEVFPDAQFVVIEGASHFAFEEQPGEFAADVARFLTTVK